MQFKVQPRTWGEKNIGGRKRERDWFSLICSDFMFFFYQKKHFFLFAVSCKRVRTSRLLSTFFFEYQDLPSPGLFWLTLLCVNRKKRAG